jgi:hypothetical protein
MIISRTPRLNMSTGKDPFDSLELSSGWMNEK